MYNNLPQIHPNQVENWLKYQTDSKKIESFSMVQKIVAPILRVKQC